MSILPKAQPLALLFGSIFPHCSTAKDKPCTKRHGCGRADPIGGVRARWIAELEEGDELLFSHYLSHDQPVIVRNARFAQASVGVWTPETFDADWPADLKMHAFLSRNRYVSYHMPGSGTNLYGFTPPVRYAEVPWSDARELADKMHNTDSCLPLEAIPYSINESSKCPDEYCRINEVCSMYLFLDGQKFRHLVQKSVSLGKTYRNWDWDWLERVRSAAEWSGPAYGLGTALVIGQQDSTMTPHFDSHGNIIMQLHGDKDVVVWPPEDTLGLYPFPSNHPATRQSMLNPETFPKFVQGDRFPRYTSTRPQRGVLHAGDVLYIPLAWWHMMRSMTHLGMSVAYWHDSRRPGPYSAPPPSLQGAAPKVLARHTALIWTQLETIIKREVGDENLDRACVALSKMQQLAHVPNFAKALDGVKELLLWVFQGDPVQSGKYVEQMVASRFGVDHDRSVHIWYSEDHEKRSHDVQKGNAKAIPKVRRPDCANGGKAQSGETSGELCVIAPFRRGSNGDRKNLLELYTRYFHTFMDMQKHKLMPMGYRIMVVEQTDDLDFNRGALFNAGVHFLGKCCDSYVLGDIDMLPVGDTNLALPSPPQGPSILHLTRELWGFNGANSTDDRVYIDMQEKPKGDYFRERYFGGVVYATREAFEMMNGFSNNFWGWGGEDDDLRLRAIAANLFGSSNGSEAQQWQPPRPGKGKGVWRHIELIQRSTSSGKPTSQYKKNVARLQRMGEIVLKSKQALAGSVCQEMAARFAMWKDGLSTVQYDTQSYQTQTTHAELHVRFPSMKTAPIKIPWEMPAEEKRVSSDALDCSAYVPMFGPNAEPPIRSVFVQAHTDEL